MRTEQLATFIASFTLHKIPRVGFWDIHSRLEGKYGLSATFTAEFPFDISIEVALLSTQYLLKKKSNITFFVVFLNVCYFTRMLCVLHCEFRVLPMIYHGTIAHALWG